MSSRVLAGELKAVGADRIRELCLSRLQSPSAEVVLAAVQAAGQLEDQQAVDVLIRLYDSDQGGEKNLRLAILDAVDACGNESITCKTVTVPLMPVGFYLVSVRNEAAAAELFCLANNGVPPVAWPAAALLTYTVP